MAFLGTCTLLLNLLLQVFASPFPDGVLDPGEKARIENESNVEQRIKIYTSASKRIQRTIDSAAEKGDFGTVPDDLKKWTVLLAGSLDDIETNLKKKKKSRPLIRYEIELRKFIADLQKLKIKAPAEQREIFDSSISEAEGVRKRFVGILFQN